MINKLKHYISYRIICLIVLFELLILTLLVVDAWIAIRDGIFYTHLIFLYILFGLLNVILYRWIYKPYRKNTKLMQLFVSGYTLQGILDQKDFIDPSTEQVIAKVNEVLNANERMNSYRRQAEYIALQNQINPHFLYNTLEGIRGEALQRGLNSVAEMTEALATFFRYNMSNREHIVTLEDELHNAENYFKIQEFRFGERIRLEIELEEEKEVLEYKLPKLTLQPIIENAIYHGLERKVDKGTVRIKIETTPSRMIITVSDDGLGMDQNQLKELNYKLNNFYYEYNPTDIESKGGIALVNVNRRIKLLFGEEYGLCVYSTYQVGTDVEITIPLIKRERKYERGNITVGKPDAGKG